MAKSKSRKRTNPSSIRTPKPATAQRSAGNGRNTVSNYQIQKRAQAARVTWVDRIAAWIGRRSRLTRSVLCALIALAFTAGTAIMLYGSLYNVDPRRISFGPINSATIPYFVLLGLSVAGFAFYWAGWRVMIGFDFEETPLQPGRAAALWLVFGLFMLVFVVLFAAVAIITAVQA